MNAIYGAITACATTMLLGLAGRVAIRGAIEVGAGTDFFDGEIYEPVLANADQLESEEAQHPRILIGSGLQDLFLNAR